MNKAPVLSDEEIQKAVHGYINPAIDRKVAQAQRDKDDAYYRPLIEQVAREIFDEVEAYCQSGQCWLKTESPFNWQSLKSKYLEYCVDCNGEVAVKLEDCPKFKEEQPMTDDEIEAMES